MKKDCISRRRWPTRTAATSILFVLVLFLVPENGVAATEVDLRTPEYPDVGAFYVHLHWSRTEDWLFAHYEILVKAEEWQVMKTIGNPDKTHFNVTDLEPDTVYQFKVRDCDTFGCQDSNIVSARTLVLEPVVMYSPTPDDTRHSSIVLRWSITFNLHFDAYQVVERKEDGNVTLARIVDQFDVEYVVTGLKENTTYCFFIKVENSLGELSRPSNTVCVTTATLEEKGFWEDPYHIALLALVAVIVCLVVILLVRRRTDGL